MGKFGYRGGTSLGDQKTRKAGVEEGRLEEVVKRLIPNMKGLVDICQEGFA